jgi:hypothetical protein
MEDKIIIPEEVQFSLPNWQNIKESFNLTPFQETRKGQTLINQWLNNVKISKWIKYIGYGISGFIAIIYFFDKPGFWQILWSAVAFAIAMLPFYFVYKIYQKSVVAITQSRYYKGRDGYNTKVTDALRNYFNAYSYEFGNATCFIFNENFCMFVNTNEGGWIGYHANNIKSVDLTQVNIGSTTLTETSHSGTAIAWTNSFATYQGSSSSTSHTTNHFEYKLDVYSDFVDMPNITVVFPDNADGQEYAKKAKALLSMHL